MTISLMSLLTKNAFQPMPGGMPPAPPPQDPSMGPPPGAMPPGGGMPPGVQMGGPAPMPSQGMPQGQPQMDPQTGLPIDPNSGLPMDPQSGLLVDMQNQVLLDPQSGQPVADLQGNPIGGQPGGMPGGQPGMPGPEQGMPGAEGGMPSPDNMMLGQLPVSAFIELLQAVLQAAVLEPLGNLLSSGKFPTEEMGDKKKDVKDQMNEKLDAILSAIAGGTPTGATGSAPAPEQAGVMSSGSGMPAMMSGMEAQAGATSVKRESLADMILRRTR